MPSFRPVSRFTLGIIGTAGRGNDAMILGATLYDKMYDKVVEAVRNLLFFEHDALPFTIISGGAAWADHLAIRFYALNRDQYPSMRLRLELPARFDKNRVEFLSEGGKAAATANLYHRKMSRVLWGATGINGSLNDIADMIQEAENSDRVEFTETPDTYGYGAFFKRNSEVARRSTHLIAFTSGGPGSNTIPETDFIPWSSSRVRGLKDGGTADTWDKCQHAKTLHIDITRI